MNLYFTIMLDYTYKMYFYLRDTNIILHNVGKKIFIYVINLVFYD